MGTGMTRRRFAISSAMGWAGGLAGVCVPRWLWAQSAMTSVAAMERERVLGDAPAALAAKPRSLMEVWPVIATLTAAFVLTQEARYAERVGALLQAWFVEPATRLAAVPQVDRNGLETILPLAEIARAVTLLVDALPESTLAGVNASFAATLGWLTTAPEAMIARDTKDHRASMWLLLVAALARGQRNELVLDDCRHRFRRPTLRNQIDAQGHFPQEMATANPYRNTLFNFDLLCGACQLLDTAFDQLWLFELPDGPGMRTVSAFVYPVIAEPEKWPGVADAEHFRDLPGRRPGLLFAGRAYKRAEYVALWASTPHVIAAGVAGSFPIREPLLWVTRAGHGL